MQHNLDYKNNPRYSTYKRRAEEKYGGQAVISEEEFNSISSQCCYYCDKEGLNGIDRFDNNKGYQKDNCVPCCKHFNYVKGNLSKEDFDIWKARFVAKQCKIK